MVYRIAYKKPNSGYDILLENLTLDDLKAVIAKHWQDGQRLPENVWSKITCHGNYRQLTIGRFLELLSN